MKVSEVTISYKPKVKASERPSVKSSRTAVELLRPFFEEIIDYKEVFYVVLLNRGNKVLGVSKISEGGTSGTVADGKIIFQTALKANATALILCHNHPSGNLRPSQADLKLTKDLKKFGELIDLQILDHVILTSEGYLSFADEGII